MLECSDSLILSQLRAREAPEQLCNFKTSLNYIICGYHSSQLHGSLLWCASLCLLGPVCPFSRRKFLNHLHTRRGFPMLRRISICPFLGIFWLVFSEGLWSSWKPLCLKLEILETLFLFISIWLISIYDLCNVLPCGSLEFGMWTRPLFPGRKQFLPAQCREVALACSEGNLRNSFSREKHLAHHRVSKGVSGGKEGEKMRIS